MATLSYKKLSIEKTFIIEYVEDPNTHKRIPTVNRAQYTSIFDDADYKSALKYADGYQRSIYEEEEKTINEIQKDTLEISREEEPFDGFISFKEQAAIAQTTVTADKNPEYDTDSGNATTDKVFLLSIDEANKYFSSDSARQCKLTAYTVVNGTYTSNSNSGSHGWCLRSPGRFQDNATRVNGVGSVYYYGNNVRNGNYTVRPALWISLA